MKLSYRLKKSKMRHQRRCHFFVEKDHLRLVFCLCRNNKKEPIDGTLYFIRAFKAKPVTAGNRHDLDLLNYSRVMPPTRTKMGRQESFIHNAQT